jgi:hypothetical protein
MNFISLSEVDVKDGWLKQDGATARTANLVVWLLIELFGGRIISQHVSPSIPRPVAT